MALVSGWVDREGLFYFYVGGNYPVLTDIEVDDLVAVVDGRTLEPVYEIYEHGRAVAFCAAWRIFDMLAAGAIMPARMKLSVH